MRGSKPEIDTKGIAQKVGLTGEPLVDIREIVAELRRQTDLLILYPCSPSVQDRHHVVRDGIKGLNISNMVVAVGRTEIVDPARFK